MVDVSERSGEHICMREGKRDRERERERKRERDIKIDTHTQI